MQWGTRIIIGYIVFIGIIITMVTISMKQDVYLVSKDYYKQEIAYQDQIDKSNNHYALGEHGLKVKFAAGSDQLQLLPPQGKNIEAHMLFFRPSDASQDKQYQVRLSGDQWQPFYVKELGKGLWKLKINWEDEGKEFYMEKTLVL